LTEPHDLSVAGDLPTGAPELNRDETLELLEQLNAALVKLRNLRAS